MEDETDFNESIVVDGQRLIYSIQVFMAILCTLTYVFLERFKNFEKFNIDASSRNSLIK
jgi:hypothetical protein